MTNTLESLMVLNFLNFSLSWIAFRRVRLFLFFCLCVCVQGMDAILVLVPCPTLTRNETLASLSRDKAMAHYQQQTVNDPAFIARVRNAVLHRMAAVEGLQNLSMCIVNEVVDTPGTYADQYHVAAGTPFALSHGLGQLSVMRPGPFSSPLENVAFCGASTRPGNGVPLVLMGAELIADKVVQKLKTSSSAQRKIPVP